MLDLNTIFSHYNPNRFFTVYGILGVGYIRGFKNDEAHTNKYTYVHPNEMTLIWENNKLNAVSGRGGLQFDFRLAKRVSFNLEGLATITTDKFNSKDGNNPDWLFAAYAGLKFRLGRIADGEFVSVAAAPAPVVAPVVEEVKEEEVVVEPAPAPAPRTCSRSCSRSGSAEPHSQRILPHQFRKGTPQRNREGERSGELPQAEPQR